MTEISIEDDWDGFLPEISFKKTEHDFGKIFSGEKVVFSFSLSNTGNGPLVIFIRAAAVVVRLENILRSPSYPVAKHTLR